MRKNVLFIARFNNVLKGMNTVLSNTFNMQMCPPTPEMLEKTLSVVEMDLVLFYLSGLTGMQIVGLCAKLTQENVKVPIVVFGSTEECEDFRNTHWDISVMKYLYRPIAPSKIVETLAQILNVKAETTPPADGGVPDATPNMSLADFADSLETDERRTILVVDDNGVILRAMKVLLEKNYKVNLANSAKSAFDAIRRERPDAVLLDYEMPIISGKQFLEQLRNDPEMQTLPVFFLTGVADKERIREAVSLKPQGYFLKSSNPNVILDGLGTFFKKI